MKSNKSNKTAFWERQSGESRQAYHAFSVYRDAGVTRSLRAVARELDKSLTIIGRWSSRWLWVARAEAWDMEQERKRAAERDRQIVVHLDVAANLGRMLQQRGIAGIRELELRQAEGKSVVRPPLEIVRYIVAGIAEERRALGLPSDAVIVDHRGAVADPGVEALRRATDLLR